MRQAAPHRLDMVLLAAGFTVWAVVFVAQYGLHGLGCALAWHQVSLGPASALRLVLGLVWLGGLVAAGSLALWSLRRAALLPGMMPRAASAASLAGLAAVALTGLPAALLTLCR